MSTISRSVATDRASWSGVAAEGLLHPVAGAAVALLLVNDHVLKAAFPGVVTGKLSDLAGLAFFPLFLEGVWELVERARRGRVVRSRTAFLWAAVLTALVFALVKTVPMGAEAYRWGLAALRWPFLAVTDLAVGDPMRPLGRVALARDATDLLTLPTVFFGLLATPRRPPVTGER
jgi:hypothetical protein